MGNCVSSQSQAGAMEQQAASTRGRGLVAMRKVWNYLHSFYLRHNFTILFTRLEAISSHFQFLSHWECERFTSYTDQSAARGGRLRSRSGYQSIDYAEAWIESILCLSRNFLQSHHTVFVLVLATFIFLFFCCLASCDDDYFSQRSSEGYTWPTTLLFFYLVVSRPLWKSIRFQQSVVWQSTTLQPTEAAAPRRSTIANNCLSCVPNLDLRQSVWRDHLAFSCKTARWTASLTRTATFPDRPVCPGP